MDKLLSTAEDDVDPRSDGVETKPKFQTRNRLSTFFLRWESDTSITDEIPITALLLL